jgi:hypothetical protein
MKRAGIAWFAGVATVAAAVATAATDIVAGVTAVAAAVATVAAAVAAAVAAVVSARAVARGADSTSGDVRSWFRGLRVRLAGVLWRYGGDGEVLADGGAAAWAGWRVMWLAARLMPPSARARWLAEAESFLAESPPALRRGAIGSYVASAPQVIALSWAAAAGRRVRLIGRGPAAW